MNWWSIAFSFFKTDLGKQILGGIGIALTALVVMLYINNIKGERDNAIEDKKEAENNVVLISREFELLYNIHTSLEKDYSEQQKYHEYSINLLNEQHLKDLKLITQVTKIKTEIENVTDENDGAIAPILSTTLDAIGLLD